MMHESYITLIVLNFFWGQRLRLVSTPRCCFPMTQMVKHLPAMWETRIWSLGREDPLEKEMAPHSSVLAWKIPWAEEPSRLHSMGFQELDPTEQLHLHLQHQGLMKRVSLQLFRLYLLMVWAGHIASTAVLSLCHITQLNMVTWPLLFLGILNTHTHT